MVKKQMFPYCFSEVTVFLLLLLLLIVMQEEWAKKYKKLLVEDVKLNIIG